MERMAKEWESEAPWDTLPDTLAQICSIPIKETHFLHLAVHSEWQTSCNLGFRKECLCNVCAMPQSGWEEKDQTVYRLSPY